MSSPASKKRKLIYLWPYKEWGGAQLYMLTIIKQASEYWDVVVALPRSSKPDLLEFYAQYNVPIEFLDHHFDAKAEKSLFGKLRRQFERIRSEIGAFRYLNKFDLGQSVVHIEVAPWQSWILLTLLSFRGASVFVTLNNFRPEASSWRRLVWKGRFQIVCRLPGFHIFASNRDVKESLREWLPPSYWKSVPVAYSPIDPLQIAQSRESEVDLAELRNEVGVSKNDFVVLAVGQFIDRKGRWVFLEAAKKVLDADRDVRFVWLMPEEITEDDKKRIEAYELKNRFIPVLSEKAGKDRVSIFNFFRTADVFALPSYVEGLPIALIEAMALGVPSISTNVYAIPEAIISGETGILVEPGDSSALASEILRLRHNPNLRERLSRDGSRFAIEHFDGNIMAKSYLESYERCFE